TSFLRMDSLIYTNIVSMLKLEYTARPTVSPDITILPRIVDSRKAKAISTKIRLSATDPMLWDVGRKSPPAAIWKSVSTPKHAQQRLIIFMDVEAFLS